jgi:hypothetical protein
MSEVRMDFGSFMGGQYTSKSGLGRRERPFAAKVLFFLGQNQLNNVNCRG